MRFTARSHDHAMPHNTVATVTMPRWMRHAFGRTVIGLPQGLDRGGLDNDLGVLLNKAKALHVRGLKIG